MAEHPGFNLRRIDGRSMVRLRVRPNGAVAAAMALQLPQQAMEWRSGEPAVCWLGPDQWLLTSDTRPAEELVGHADRILSNLLHAATDMSSHYVCFALNGPAARSIRRN